MSRARLEELRKRKLAANARAAEPAAETESEPVDSSSEEVWTDVPETEEVWTDVPDTEEIWTDVPEPSVSQGEAAALGVAQGATFYFSDEVGAFLETGKVSGKQYETAVKTRRDRLKEAQTAWPKTYMGAEIGGGLVSAFLLPMGRAAQAGSTAKAAWAAAKTASVEGGFAGLGWGEGSVKEQATSVAAGIVMGGAAGGAMGALVKGAPKLWKKLKAGEAGEEAEKEVIDLIGRTDVRAKSSAVVDDAVFNSISKEGRVTISPDDISPKGITAAPNTGTYAKEFLTSKFGNQTDDVIDFYKTQQIRGLEEAREKIEPFYIRPKEVDLEGVERTFAKSKKPTDYNQVSEAIKEVEGLSGKKILLDDPNEDYIRAYYAYRNEVIQYMEYVVTPVRSKPVRTTTSTIEANRYEIAKFDDRYIEKLHKSFEDQVKQGRATDVSWKNHKYGQYLAEELEQRNQEIALSNTRAVYEDGTTESQDLFDKYVQNNLVKLENDPLNTKVGKLLDIQIVAQLSDDVTGLDFSLIVREMYTADIQKTGFVKEFSVARVKAKKLGQKADHTPETIGKSLNEYHAADETAQAYRDILDTIRERLNAAGANIDYRDPYFPAMKKNGAELIRALEGQYKKLGIQAMDDTAEIKSLLRRVEVEDIDDIIEGLHGGQKDLAVFTSYLKSHTNRSLYTLADINDAMEVGVLHGAESLKRASNPELGAAFKRKGKMPEWIQEWNADLVIHRYTENAGKFIYLEPVAKKMDQRVPVLRRLKQHKTAEMMHNWRQDVMGLYRDSIRNNASRVGIKYNLWAGDKGAIAQGVPEVLDVMSTAIYPNLIGLSPKAVLRNTFQPSLMTVPEMGWWYGTKKAVQAYRKLFSQGWSKSMAELDSYGLLPKKVGAEAFEGLETGVTESVRGMQTTKEAINSYSNVVMFAFEKSDHMNRYVTLQMAKGMAADITSDSTSNALRNAMDTLPSAVKRAIKRIQNDSGVDTQESLTKLLGDYYVGTTQLIYGKTGMHELGRDIGPLMSMMTRWPVAVGSDMYYRLQKKDFGFVIKKYFAPLMAANVLSGMLLSEDDIRTQALLGSSGFQDYLPVNSMFSIQNIVWPVNVASISSYGTQFIKGMGESVRDGGMTEETRKKLGKTARRAVQQYVPIGGGLWRARDQYWRIVLGEQP